MKKITLVFMVLLLILCTTTSAFAAVDPAVIIVNPVHQSTTTSSNILISVKVTQPKIIKITLFEDKEVINGVSSSIDLNQVAQGKVPKKENIQTLQSGAMLPATFTTTNNLTFCTKQVNGIKPGLYRLRVDTLDGAGKVIYSRESTFGVKTKVESDEKLFENQQSGTFQFLQNILKSIFGS